MRKNRVIVQLVALAVFNVVAASGTTQVDSQSTAGPPLPMPTFHHIHLNSVNPDKSLEWYARYWPKGRQTTFARFPAFSDGQGFYLLYNKVSRQAPGAFDSAAERSVPQSAFWTFGSTFPGADTKAVRERLSRLDPRQFQFVTLHGGSDGKQTAINSMALPLGGQLLTGSAIRERTGQGSEPRPATSGLDFAYLVDPDGMLVEVTSGNEEGFRSHTHFWAERPLCTANWHVEHLGAEFPTTQNSFDRGFTFRNGKWDPCDVPIGEVTYPTYITQGQLRIPAGNARIANASWLWYPRQCRSGRCGTGNDQPLSRSRGQVVDHIGLTYPDLDVVMRHLRSKGVRILEGPYKFGDTRAVLIEDPDGLAFELIETKKQGK
jgi:catechol 2,3-dioxygenase-like lactoylglutathione lyase family enzyme